MEHSSGFLSLIDAARANVREVSIAQALERIKANPNAHFVDVREDREWNVGHAEGAIHMGKGIIERDIEKRIPDKGAEIILYCGGGFRSVLSAESLQRMGYTNVASMAGGWREWVAGNNPVDL
ncbi:MAG: sulfurtransferase [Gemmatimonadetes bacterium]|nr:sulfurtransferase [Gemmatimonadota bacterium]